MFSKFEGICEYEEFKFDAKNQQVRCLAHIINLAVQNLLKTLKEEAPENENEILQENSSIQTLGVVAKVRIYLLYYIKLSIILITFCFLLIASNINSKNSSISSKKRKI